MWRNLTRCAHFVIVSARSPSGIYPILIKNEINCAIISFSGAMIMDEKRNILYQNEMSTALSKRIIDFIESRNHFPEVNVVKSSDILLEIMKKDVNKAESVKRYCEYLSIDIHDAVAFGDNYNDLEMLEQVGLGVLMGNAPEELKNRFKHITEENDHDGGCHDI